MINLQDLSIRYRGPSLFDEVTATIVRGDKIGLLGRNGCGKTTLLRILAGEETPDHGRIVLDSGVKISRLIQDVPADTAGTVDDVIRRNVTDRRPAHRIEAAITRAITDFGLDADAEVSTMSSGMRRRVLLAAAIAAEPDALLLDEPTNHLDIESIERLEKFLARWPGTVLLITHDRAFLQAVCRRIWEIERGRLFDWTCDYATFLRRKEAALEAEAKQAELDDKRLAQEEAWIRQGIKARRTRNEGRVRRLEQMRLDHANRRSGPGSANIQVQQAARGGVNVAKLTEVTFSRPTPDGGQRKIVSDLTTTIYRGDRIGIIGPNGAGKTTLLRLILGQLKPDSGNVKLGTGLQIAYFDQLRDTLDPEATVAENVGEGSDRVQVGDVTQHLYGYLQNYLFSPERSRTQVKFLSGGERHRVLLAKLMTRPANVLVLDEPTNDLDLETLELLEAQLMEFTGTVLVVSHDREFLDRVVTSTMVLGGEGFPAGHVGEYVGGYTDYQRVAARQRTAESTSSPAAKSSVTVSKTESKKLSYKDQRELDQLPGLIEQLETQIAEVHESMAAPGFFKQPAAEITAATDTLAKLTADQAAAYARWEALEG